jgi:hypothetical protein
MNHSNKPYSSQDLMRYVRGEMSPSEQHALEKAALEDPFLSDALEGYMAHPQDEETLLSLQHSIKSIQSKSNPSSGKIWFMRPLSIAAAISVLFFAGYVALQSDEAKTNKKTEPQFAENKQTEAIKETVTNIQADPSKTPLEKTPAQSVKTVENLPSKNQQSVDEKPTESVAFTAPVVAEDVNAAPLESSKQEADLDVQHPTTTDDATKFNLTSIEAKDKALNNVESVQITAAMATKKTRTNSPTAKQMQTYGSLSDEQQFQAYLDKQPNRICASTTGDAWHGEIILSFSVNRKSRPTDIRLESMGDAGCVEASKDILKNGPDWDKSIQGRRTIRIRW